MVSHSGVVGWLNPNERVVGQHPTHPINAPRVPSK